VQPEVSTLGDVVGSGVVGVGRGVAGLAGLPGDIQQAGNWMRDKLEQGETALGLWSPEKLARARAARAAGETPGIQFPTSQGIVQGVENVTGPLYQPKTKAGQYAETIGEFVPSVIGGEGNIAKRVITGAVIPGVASEAAGEAAEGTPWEPYARVGAAILAQHGAGRLANTLAGRPPAITEDELFKSAQQKYNAAHGFGIEIDKKPVADLANDIISDLQNDGFRSINAPGAFSTINELKNPVGANVTLGDFDSVRKALGKMGRGMGANAPTERAAASRAISAMDDYLENLSPGDVNVNPQFAGRVSDMIKDARTDYGAGRRLQTINDLEEAAVDRAASTYAGGNVNNASRQNLRWIIDPRHPERQRGFTDDEINAMRQVVRGTAFGNVTRYLGKLAPTGIVSGKLGIELGAAAGAVYGQQHGDPLTGGLIGAVGLPVFGKINKVLGDRSTARGYADVKRMIGQRSTLGAAQTPPARIGFTGAAPAAALVQGFRGQQGQQPQQAPAPPPQQASAPTLAPPPGVPPGSSIEHSPSTGRVRWVAPDGRIYPGQ
jgi:hypothetical protein